MSNADVIGQFVFQALAKFFAGVFFGLGFWLVLYLITPSIERTT